MLYFLLALLGIGLIIFIHEAGHFFAAKKVGVRVERFALGFDPPIGGRNLRFFAFQRGETEYVLGMIPFGGYVKLAGEALAEQGTQPKPDELLAKSVGARAVVFAAGALMNIASAVVLFIVAFSFGVSFPEPTIGVVRPGSAAWEAGLRPGDTVLAINDKEINDFTEISLAAALSSTEDILNLRVSRPSNEDGKTPKILEFSLSSRLDATRGLNILGVGPASTDRLEAVPRESAAAEAGLEEGDRIVGAVVAGRELPPIEAPYLLTAVSYHLRFYPHKSLTLEVQRDGRRSSRTLRMREDSGATPLTKLLVWSDPWFAGSVVKEIAPESDARDVFQPGDKVASVNGRPVGTLHWLTIHTEFLPGPLELQLERDGQVRSVTVEQQQLLYWNIRNEIVWTAHRAEIGSMDETAPLAGQGLQIGDVVVSAGGTPVYEPGDIAKALAKHQGASVEIEVVRGPNRLPLTIGRGALQEPAGVRWRTFPTITNLAPSGPAGKAGMAPGSRIVKIGDRDIFEWSDLVEYLDGVTPFTAVDVEWEGPGGERQKAKVSVGFTPYEDSGLVFAERRKIVQAGLVGSFVLGAERTVVVAKQVFLTLRSLVRRDVSAKNLAGPVGITHVFTLVAEMGVVQLIYWMAIVSVNLGLLNLLPFPILDGGHLFFLVIEKIKGSPVDVRVQEWAIRVAFLLIISLALFVTWHDLRRLFFT